MIPSVIGGVVAIAVGVVGYLSGSTLLFGLFIALPFGSTAIGAVPALGGSTPLIYTVFVGLLLITTMLKRGFRRDLGTVFRLHWSAVVAVLVAVYAVFSAVIFPRLFLGQTTMLVPIEGVVTEVPLTPSPGNITQSAYFVLGVLAFFAVRISLLNPSQMDVVRRGFLTFAGVHVALGIVDLAGKFAGLGDILADIRTANYALLTNAEVSGFFRISGGFPEASSYSATSLACIAFTFTYWRVAGSKVALGLTLILFGLLVLSTSTTAYAGLAALVFLGAVSIGFTFFSGRIKVQDVILFVVLTTGLAVALTAYLLNEKMFDPIIEMLRIMVLEKADSESGKERAYWNYQSMQAFLDTDGIGIGFGSSRSSSWLISVFSQMGVLGGLMIAALGAAILRGTAGLRAEGQKEIYGLAAGAQAMSVGWLTSITISGGAADPGLLFFLPLAVVLACRTHLYNEILKQRRSLSPPSSRIPYLPDDALIR